MVLLNGVKYACERCIRGHRVSSCSHTDKPLVMIKPKGRPASQCTHCREQRKIKNTHVSCNCGKKGKSPGQHLASCPCHKNSHCTCVCVSKEKKPASLHGVKKKLTPDTTASDSGDTSQNEAVQASSSDSVSVKPLHASAPSQDSDFLIEDIALPFETEGGLLDYFSSSKSLPFETPEEPLSENGHFSANSEFRSSQMSHSGSSASPQSRAPYHSEFGSTGQNGNDNSSKGFSSLSQGDSGHLSQSQRLRSMNYFPNPPSDADLDLMENMFPLFPLVGFNSFEDDKSLPLSGLPDQHGSSSDVQALQNRYGRAPSSIDTGEKTEGSQPVPVRSRGDSLHQQSTSAHANLHSNHQSSISLQSMNGTTHHPRPLKPSTSFSGGHSTNRPKRSESVMSAASTSSTTSKQNLFETPQLGSLHFPKSSSSAAFPPFNLSDNNSNDDFHHMSFNSPGLYNENKSLPILSDEDLPKNGQLSGNITPQSSISRQLSLNRRKTSLSRSHSQLHHNANATPKEHVLFPAKAGSSADMSPRQGLERKLGSFEGSLQNATDIDSYLREVAEESSSLYANEAEPQQPSTDDIMGICQPSENQPGSDFGLEHSDFSQIPMYQQLFEPLQNTM